ncbi:MAG TPA: glycosyltransferase family 9 protein [Fimbriimonadales bacterium]|nr:glycosyltransferase family 9 protein [Fimbriimonadales bacterium]
MKIQQNNFMLRYEGQALNSSAKIAVLANDALGNFAICTPLLQALRYYYPDSIIDYYGGERTKELETASIGTLFDWRISLLGKSFSETAQQAIQRRQDINGYDLVINIEDAPLHRTFTALIGEGAYVCGPCLAPDSRSEWDFPDDERGDLWRDRKWASPDLPMRYPFLETGFIAEIFMKLAYMEGIPNAPWRGGIPRYWFPCEEISFDVPDILISTGASLKNKLWRYDKWANLLRDLRREGYTIGLLGAPPKSQRQFYHSAKDEDVLVEQSLVEDLRGKFSLPQVVYALKRCEFVITLDNGILHFAAAHDKPTIGLYRKEIAPLWAPPNPNLTVLTPEEGDVENIEVEEVLSSFTQMQKRYETKHIAGELL